jgi:hypothetical protein
MNAEDDLQTQMARPRSSERYPATTIRLSLAFKRQVQEMAVANHMSMSAFIVLALDDYLVRMGRPSLVETDAAFIAFLRREKGSDR